MARRHRSATRRMRGRLSGAGTAADVRVTMTYTPNDSYAIAVDIEIADMTTRWVFARELLAEGVRSPVHAPAGEHIVHVWSSLSSGEPVVSIRLSCKNDVVVQLPNRDVMAFLLDSYSVVPIGLEYIHCDVDKELAKVLADES